MKEKLKKFWDSLEPEDILCYWLPPLVLIVMIIGFIATVMMYPSLAEAAESDIPTEYTHTVYLVIQDERETEPEPESETPQVAEEPEPTGYQFTEEEINLIATLVMAEAGNQSELGKRLVIDVVLNRLDHPNFPKTVYDVIYQRNQFSPATSGTIDLYSATEDHVRLVREEIERRTDHDVVFFRADQYGRYGVPMYRIGDHYFSSYD